MKDHGPVESGPRRGLTGNQAVDGVIGQIEGRVLESDFRFDADQVLDFPEPGAYGMLPGIGLNDHAGVRPGRPAGLLNGVPDDLTGGNVGKQGVSRQRHRVVVKGRVTEILLFRVQRQSFTGCQRRNPRAVARFVGHGRPDGVENGVLGDGCGGVCDDARVGQCDNCYNKGNFSQ